MYFSIGPSLLCYLRYRNYDLHWIMPCTVIACGARETECSCGCCDGGLVHIFLFVGDAVVADGGKLDSFCCPL